MYHTCTLFVMVELNFLVCCMEMMYLLLVLLLCLDVCVCVCVCISRESVTGQHSELGMNFLCVDLPHGLEVVEF